MLLFQNCLKLLEASILVSSPYLETLNCEMIAHKLPDRNLKRQTEKDWSWEMAQMLIDPDKKETNFPCS
jgi:hypothetical protein